MVVDRSPLPPAPCYLFRPSVLDQRLADLRSAFGGVFPKLRIAYSYKTNYLPYLLRRLHSAEIGAPVDAEVVSSLEYELARRLGVPGDRIVFNGPNKGAEALDKALAEGALVHLDSREEVDAVLGLDRPVDVGLRLNVPHPEGEGHRACSRFGLPAAELEIAARDLRAGGHRLRSLHVHLATRARDVSVFRGLARSLADAARRLDGPDLQYLDLGGGLGWAPPELDAFEFPSFGEVARAAYEELRDVLESPEGGERTLILEPGMALVNDSFAYLAPVRALKTVAGRRLAVVDGSVHTVKPTRHRHNLPTRVFDAGGTPRGQDLPRKVYDVVGYSCMDDDFLAIDQELPELRVGDVLRIDCVGAYTLVFKPPFIRAMPAVWAETEEGWELARREETLEDFLRGTL